MMEDLFGCNEGCGVRVAGVAEAEACGLANNVEPLFVVTGGGIVAVIVVDVFVGGGSGADFGGGGGGGRGRWESLDGWVSWGFFEEEKTFEASWESCCLAGFDWRGERIGEG